MHCKNVFRLGFYEWEEAELTSQFVFFKHNFLLCVCNILSPSLSLSTVLPIFRSPQSETPLRHLKGHSYKKRVEDKWKQLIWHALTREISKIVVACQACDNIIPNFHFAPTIESCLVSVTTFSQNATNTPEHPFGKEWTFVFGTKKEFPEFFFLRRSKYEILSLIKLYRCNSIQKVWPCQKQEPLRY